MLLLTKFVHYIGLKTRLSFGLWPRICLFNVELRFFSVNVLFDCSAAVFFLSSLWLIQHWSGYVDDSSHFLHHYNITNFCGPVDESPCYLWDSLVLIPTHWADTAIQQTTLRKKPAAPNSKLMRYNRIIPSKWQCVNNSPRTRCVSMVAKSHHDGQSVLISFIWRCLMAQCTTISVELCPRIIQPHIECDLRTRCDTQWTVDIIIT